MRAALSDLNWAVVAWYNLHPSGVVYIIEDVQGKLYRCQTRIHTPSHLLTRGDPLDLTTIYPALNPMWTVYDQDAHHPSVDIFTKKPLPGSDQEGDADRLMAMSDELDILEQLGSRHSENICRYYGCIVQNGLVVGLQLEKLGFTLREALEDGFKVNPDKLVADIRSAMEHIEALGLVYADLHPGNIMRADRGWCLIDFEHCYPIGTHVAYVGRRGWGLHDHTYTRATKEILLAKLWKYAWTGKRPKEPLDKEMYYWVKEEDKSEAEDSDYDEDS